MNFKSIWLILDAKIPNSNVKMICFSLLSMIVREVSHPYLLTWGEQTVRNTSKYNTVLFNTSKKPTDIIKV